MADTGIETISPAEIGLVEECLTAREAAADEDFWAILEKEGLTGSALAEASSRSTTIYGERVSDAAMKRLQVYSEHFECFWGIDRNNPKLDEYVEKIEDARLFIDEDFRLADLGFKDPECREELRQRLGWRRQVEVDEGVSPESSEASGRVESSVTMASYVLQRSERPATQQPNSTEQGRKIGQDLVGRYFGWADTLRRRGEELVGLFFDPKQATEIAESSAKLMQAEKRLRTSSSSRP